MRIGVVTQPYYPIRSGVSEHVYHLGRELVQRGHEVVVVTGRGSSQETRGLRVVEVGPRVSLTLNGASVQAVVGFGFRRKLRVIEERERFDLVHVHSPLDPILPLAATEHLRVPVVGTFHSFRPTNPFAVFFPQRYRRALSRLRARIAVSPSAAGFVTRYIDVPFHIIPNGVDTKRFSPEVDGFQTFRDGTFTILYVGRMDPRKGARYLLQALPLIERELEHYRLLIVGGGWRKKVYQQFISPGLERRVHFAGVVSWEDLPRYYRSADLYCSPATGGESFGIVLLEAMASGLPIVASDIEGYRHVMTESEGMFAVPRDPSSIAAKIVELARDAQRRMAMAEAGRATALRYDWKMVADKVLAVYQEVLA